jgi:hypothetical protein
MREARRAAGVGTAAPVLTEQEVELARLRGPVDSTLRTTAAIYKAAAAVGDPPLQAVERTLGLPRSTAGRWVSLARGRGLLGRSAAAGGRR